MSGGCEQASNLEHEQVNFSLTFENGIQIKNSEMPFSIILIRILKFLIPIISK